MTAPPEPASPFPDHFSHSSPEYRRFRPAYPEAWIAQLASLAPRRRRAWDVGCGNGQAAQALALFFQQVVAMDPSFSQLAAMGSPLPNLQRICAPAETGALVDDQFDLVTIAQALHWFDLDRFWPEVARVARQDAVVVAWTYDLLTVDDGGPVDQLLRHFYGEVVGEYWPPQRRYVESGYADLPFPFEELPVTPPPMEDRWAPEQVLGYVGTWSAVRRYRVDRGEDPLSALATQLARRWPSGLRRVRWPLRARVGRVEG
ncbi:MAG: class I SAM-dependent methyltransferase [Acidobacteriota bacterium]